MLWLVLTLLGSFLVMALFLWVGWLSLEKRITRHSPYSEMPLRSSSELSYSAIGKIFLYLTRQRQYDNRMFDIHRALVCRETRRVFPNAMDWFGRVKLDWTFLQKRYPGNWVSWGSLTARQQQAIRQMHGTLDGFQTEFSSPDPSPRATERQYALSVPGPLYVDLNTLILLGWKTVPGTDLEVLIVQKPKYKAASGPKP